MKGLKILEISYSRQFYNNDISTSTVNIAFIIQDNKIFLESSSTVPIRPNVELMTLSEFLKEISNYTKIKINKTYNEFLADIKKINDSKLPATYICLYNEDTKRIEVFRKSLVSDEVKYCFSYEPENEKFLEETKNIFRLNDTTHSIFDTNYKNNYSFLTNFYALKVIYDSLYLEEHNETVYKIWKKKCKNGKIREITAPNPLIKSSLATMNHYLQKAYDKRNSEFQTAYKKGKNVKTGAILHKDNKYQYSLDLKDFFPSCKEKYVRKYISFLFNYTFNREYVLDKFLSLILINNALTIGNPISGTIANAILSNAINYMHNICKRTNVTLTVYADDITFSSKNFLKYDYVERVFNEAMSKYELQYDFVLNKKKSIGRSNNRRKITGVVINHNNEITVPRKYFRELKSQLCHLNNGDNINIERLRGKIAYGLMIDESNKITRQLAKYLPIVKKYHLCPKKESILSAI